MNKIGFRKRIIWKSNFGSKKTLNGIIRNEDNEKRCN